MIEYILLIAGILCLIRVVLGPTIYDRIVAIDTFLILVIGIMVLWSQENPIYIDIAIVFVGLNFGSTLIFSKYLKGEKIWS